MKLQWPSIFKKDFPQSETKTATVPLAPDSFLAHVFGGGGHINAHQAMQFYQQSSSVASAVDLIAESIEQIQPVLKMQDGTFEENHPVLDLLKRPNGFDSWENFIGKAARHYLLKHDSHLAAIGHVRRPPVELHAVKPHNLSTVQGSDGLPGSYLVTFGPSAGSYQRNIINRRAQFLDGTLKEIFHVMGFSSRTTDVEGDSPLEAAALEVRQQIQGRKHNLSLLNNGGRLSLVFSFKDDGRITDDEHRERKQRIQEDLKGPNNAGGISVISGADVSIAEFGSTNKDMDYAELDKLARDCIYRRYKIPLPLVTVDAATLNNYQTAILSLYDQTVLPTVDVLLGGMSLFLLPRYGLDPTKVEITYNPDTIPALASRRLDQLEKRTKLKLETTNELRTLLPNRDPLEGGDTLYHPATEIPLGTDVTQAEAQLQAEELERANA